MRAFRRPGWSLLLACCLLLQAAWSTAAMACAPRHAAPVSVSTPASASAGQPACHDVGAVRAHAAASEALDPVPDVSAHSHAAGPAVDDAVASSAEPPAAGLCSACAACLLGSALPVRLAALPAPSGAPAAPAPATAFAVSFLADGPERPPRPAPAAR